MNFFTVRRKEKSKLIDPIDLIEQLTNYLTAFSTEYEHLNNSDIASFFLNIFNEERNDIFTPKIYSYSTITGLSEIDIDSSGCHLLLIAIRDGDGLHYQDEGHDSKADTWNFQNHSGCYYSIPKFVFVKEAIKDCLTFHNIPFSKEFFNSKLSNINEDVSSNYLSKNNTSPNRVAELENLLTSSQEVNKLQESEIKQLKDKLDNLQYDYNTNNSLNEQLSNALYEIDKLKSKAENNENLTSYSFDYLSMAIQIREQVLLEKENNRIYNKEAGIEELKERYRKAGLNLSNKKAEAIIDVAKWIESKD